MGQASRLLCPAAMALPRELDLDMGKMTVAATLGSPAGPAEEGSLECGLECATAAGSRLRHVRSFVQRRAQWGGALGR